MNTRMVVHCKKEPYDVYIGRGSKWGNPFPIGHEITNTREAVVARYAEWIKQQPDLLNSLHELHGKRLGCYCAPQLCHGDVLRELLQNHVQVEDGQVVSYDCFCTICGSLFEMIDELRRPCCKNGHYLRINDE